MWLGTTVINDVSAQQSRRNPMTTFERHAIGEEIESLPWELLLEDGKADGKIETGADGKALYYYYDAKEDRLWFKIEAYEPIETFPAISVSIDTDANQQTGVGWYGDYKSFTFEKMISIGPVREVEGKMYGYNGITDQVGVRTRNWINYNSGVVSYFRGAKGKIFVVNVKREDIEPGLSKMNLIGSIGAKALWNDDIGNNTHATVDLN